MPACRAQGGIPAQREELHQRFPPHHDKYITFEQDPGGAAGALRPPVEERSTRAGFNNIRIGFECVVAIAAITGRTLVLPPRIGAPAARPPARPPAVPATARLTPVAAWYLMDFGPIAINKARAAPPPCALHHGWRVCVQEAPREKDSTTHFSDLFNITALRGGRAGAGRP
jgi:hypothetical protein